MNNRSPQVFIFAFFIFLLSSGCLNPRLVAISLPSNENKTSAIFNWADCAAMAQKNHPELLAGREVVKQAQAAWLGSFQGFLPDASSIFSRTRKQTDNANETDSFSFITNVSEEWFSGFGNTADVLKARRNYRAEKFNYADLQSRVALDVRTAFVKLLHAQELVILRRSIAERRKINQDIVRLRYEAGREHRGSLKHAEAIYNEALFDVREAERSILIERNALLRELGGRYGLEAAASGDLLLMILPPSPAEPAFSEIVEKIPSVMRRKELKEAAGAGVIKEQSDFWPSVTGSASLTDLGNTGNLDSRTWNAGVSMNIPIFSGGEQLAGLVSARSGAREAFYTLKDIRDTAFADLIKKWTDFTSAIELVDVRKKFLEATTERAEISSVQYQDGLVSFEDWDRIEQELVDSRISLLSAERDAILAEADWLRSEGLSFGAYRV